VNLKDDDDEIIIRLQMISKGVHLRFSQACPDCSFIDFPDLPLANVTIRSRSCGKFPGADECEPF